MAKYLVNKRNLKKSKGDSCILFRKYDKGKSELVISVLVDDVFISDKPESLKVIKEEIKEEFKISESRKVKKSLGVYYQWGHDAKCMYPKMTMEKDVNKLVEGYKKYTRSDLRIPKTPGAPGKILSKSDLEDPDNTNKYISFLGQLMWYTNKVGPDVEKVARELAVHMSHPGP